MKKYVIKRVVTAFFTLLAITLILFILMQLMPGSPFNDEKLNDAQRASLYAKYGLDKPIVVQFFQYVFNMFRGDLGVSYKISKNTPITQLIASRLPISIGVGFAAVMIGAVVGLLLGLLAAFKKDTTNSSTEYFVISLNNLTANTNYDYTIEGREETNEVIYHSQGSFTTNDPQGLTLQSFDPAPPAAIKRLRGGQLLIEQKDRTYNAGGQIIQIHQQ